MIQKLQATCPRALKTAADSLEMMGVGEVPTWEGVKVDQSGTAELQQNCYVIYVLPVHVN
jgi:hypothetical protein